MRWTGEGVCPHLPRIPARIDEVAVPAHSHVRRRLLPPRAFQPELGGVEPGVAARGFDPASGAFADDTI